MPTKNKTVKDNRTEEPKRVYEVLLQMTIGMFIGFSFAVLILHIH